MTGPAGGHYKSNSHYMLEGRKNAVPIIASNGLLREKISALDAFRPC